MKYTLHCVGISLLGCVAWGCHPKGISSAPTNELVRFTHIEPLVALPLYVRGEGTAIPISSRNAISCAHLFHASSGLAAVAGRPMQAIISNETLANVPPEDRDWVQLCSTCDRFSPNRIDTTIQLRVGEPVIVGGFRGWQHEPYNAVTHSEAQAEIVEGLVTSVASPEHPTIVTVDVPIGDYRGFSGGPAAIVDRAGRVCVWGMVIGGKSIRNWLDPAQSTTRMRILRLPQAEIEQMKKMSKANPTEHAPINRD